LSVPLKKNNYNLLNCYFSNLPPNRASSPNMRPYTKQDNDWLIMARA
jgi:hypothetical protein